MKRLLVLAIIPIVLFGLETVNLIKDAGFEKDSELWLERSETSPTPDGPDSTIINRHDPDSAYMGNYSGSIDGRKRPAASLPELYNIVGYLYQIIPYPKPLKDLDSLQLYHMVLFIEEGSKNLTWSYGIDLYFTRPSDGEFIEARYFWLTPGDTPISDTPTRKVFPDTIPDERVWCGFGCDLKADLIGKKGLSEDIELDTFLTHTFSVCYYTLWYGQKAFFDGVRLTGYADYDVGVKEILSGDSLEVGTPYQPVARIKNFGRENADSFLVIAEIKNGASLIYSDTLPWTLDGDTEDTVTFADFDPPTTGPYTLTVRTFMIPDECDEDDEVSKEIGHTAVTETTLPDGLSLEVVGTSRGVLKVSFETPNGQVGNLSVYDATGRRIERMEVTRSGSVEFNLSIPSGVYFVRLETDRSALVRKALMLK